MSRSAGARFRQALKDEQPLQIVGTIIANHALMARHTGFRAIYLSGGGVAAGSLGMPDLGINTLDDVLTDTRRITDVCDLPLLVDIDTGFGPSVLITPDLGGADLVLHLHGLVDEDDVVFLDPVLRRGNRSS